ncbi:ROK family protein [Actinoallomurus sp. NPDC050550]|uniref:ROK family protein n=1 Tax=Actinoallomurus sp. NPDC050550 TaxID=3154937 RepID=UPI0033C187EC
MILHPALEIGGSHVTAALVDASSGMIAERREPLRPDGTADEIISRILRCARTLPTTKGRWGVAVPGPFDYERGIALFEGVGKFDALYGTDLGAALLDGLPGPPSSVTFLNDAVAFLLGEWTAGAAAGHRRASGITLGTGVGSAFLVDGRPVTDGPDVPPEGRVDLLTWEDRPLEDTVSSRAIRARYTGRPAADVAEISDRARAGETAAQALLTETFTALGRVLAPWLTRFGAEVLVVGGSMAASWDLLAPPLTAGLAAAGSHPVTLPACNPQGAALIGATVYAMKDGEIP